MAKDKTKGMKGASKKGKEPRNWMKIAIPLLLVIIMLMSVFAFVFSGRPIVSNNQNSGIDKSFNNIMDGLRLIPANASSVRYVDLKDDAVLNTYMHSYSWSLNTIPPSKIFNADPQRDLLAVYPAGYFGNFAQQFVSLTDFGNAKLNTSYSNVYTVGNQIALMVNSMYFFTPNTKPVISGRAESILPVLYVMYGTNASSYGDYSDLFDELKGKQIGVNDSRLEVVGKRCNFTYSDRYYAALRPEDPANGSADRQYSYVAIMHVDRTLSDNDMLELAVLSDSMEKMGFDEYNVQVYDNYVIIEAKGSLGTCIDDMLNRWGFIQYKFQG